MKRKIQVRERGLFLLLGGGALLLALRRSFVLAAAAALGGLLLYQGLTGRRLVYQKLRKRVNLSWPADEPLTGQVDSAPPVAQNPAEPAAPVAEYYDQVDEQSVQSFPASDPPATRIG